MPDHNYYSDIDDVRAVVMNAVSETDVPDDRLVRGALEVYTLINAKLGKFPGVPFPLSGETPDTPAIIRAISDKLTACWANAHTVGLSTRSRGPTAADCKEAREQIDDIASGKLIISGYTLGALPSSNTEGEHRIFDKVDTHDMGQDADQVTRLSDERD